MLLLIPTAPTFLRTLQAVLKIKFVKKLLALCIHFMHSVQRININTNMYQFSLNYIVWNLNFAHGEHYLAQQASLSYRFQLYQHGITAHCGLLWPVKK
jgi:hypothetical protein